MNTHIPKEEWDKLPNLIDAHGRLTISHDKASNELLEAWIATFNNTFPFIHGKSINEALLGLIKHFSEKTITPRPLKQLPLGAKFKYKKNAADTFVLLSKDCFGLVAKYVPLNQDPDIQQVFSAFDTPNELNTTEVFPVE